MMRRCQSKNAPLNPVLRAGLLVNALFLTLHGLLPNPCFGGLGEFFRGALAGLAIALMLLGLVVQDPRRAQARRAWKRRHLPFLSH